MRQEYSGSGMEFLVDSIKDFMSNFTNLYTLIIDDGTNLVYHVIKYDIDLVFTRQRSGHYVLACFLVKQFSGSGSSWFIQADNIVKWVGDPVYYDRYNNHPGVIRRVALPVYYPCVVFTNTDDTHVLVANYNSENDTIMFSYIWKSFINMSGISRMDISIETQNLIISDSKKYLDFDGGFFIGGTRCGCMEYNIKRVLTCTIDGVEIHRWRPSGSRLEFIGDSHANCAYFHIQPPPRCSSGPWYYPWVDSPYAQYNNRVRNDIQNISRNMPDITNLDAFDIIMYGKIDNAPYRNRGELAHFLGKDGRSGFPWYCYDGLAEDAFSTESDLAGANIHRYADWCTSFQPSPTLYDKWTDGSEGRIDYFYPIAVPSITNSTIKVPRYEPLLSADMLDNGHNVNVLNDISMVMPLYISVRRDPPEEPLSYSAVCRNDVINLVNMRYMSTNKMTNGIYPVEEHTYNCFNIGHRRNLSGFKGYQGIAFRQEDEE